MNRGLQFPKSILLGSQDCFMHFSWITDRWEWEKMIQFQSENHTNLNDIKQHHNETQASKQMRGLVINWWVDKRSQNLDLCCSQHGSCFQWQHLAVDQQMCSIPRGLLADFPLTKWQQRSVTTGVRKSVLNISTWFLKTQNRVQCHVEWVHNLVCHNFHHPKLEPPKRRRLQAQITAKTINTHGTHTSKTVQSQRLHKSVFQNSEIWPFLTP